MLLLLTLLAAQTSPQDVVVMRRQIAAPTRTSTPPAPPAPSYRWDAGAWSQTSPAQCGQTVSRTRTVRCLATGDVPVEDAKCQGDRPASQDSYVDYAGCAVTYACPSWVQDKQGSGGPHYLIYEGAADDTEGARRVRAQKLCEAQPRSRGIQICTSTIVSAPGKPDVLRILASVGYAVNQRPNAPIGGGAYIATSSIAMCSPTNP